MSSGARVVTSIGTQTGVGIAPASWQFLRVTGNTIMPKIQTVASDEITPNRISMGDVISAVDVGGDIQQELSYGTSDALLASTFFNAWAATLGAPTQTAPSTAATGGTLAPNTYFYVVSTLNAVGESTKSNELSIVTAGTLSAPVQTAPSTSTTGGTLAAATYYYKITALNANGETIGSNELSQVTTGATSTVTINWGSVAGATGYKIYRGTAAGAESVFYTVGAVTTFSDTGAASTAGTVPVTNTAGSGTNTINWGAVTGATGYKIYRGTATGLQTVFYTVGTVTTFTDTGAANTAGVPLVTSGSILTLGNTAQYFSIAKDFSDVGVYGVARDLIVAKAVLTIPTSGKNTVVFTTAGLKWEDNKTGTFAPTPTAATTTHFLSSTNLGSILINGAVAPSCVSALSVTIDNLVNVQRCLGQGLVAGAQISGGAKITGSVTLAWSAAAYDIWNKTFNRATVSIQFPISDAAGNTYTVVLPACEVQGDLPNAAKTAIVEVTLNFNVIATAPFITR